MNFHLNLIYSVSQFLFSQPMFPCCCHCLGWVPNGLHRKLFRLCLILFFVYLHCRLNLSTDEFTCNSFSLFLFNCVHHFFSQL